MKNNGDLYFLIRNNGKITEQFVSELRSRLPAAYHVGIAISGVFWMVLWLHRLWSSIHSKVLAPLKSGFRLHFVLPHQNKCVVDRHFPGTRSEGRENTANRNTLFLTLAESPGIGTTHFLTLVKSPDRGMTLFLTLANLATSEKTLFETHPKSAKTEKTLLLTLVGPK